MSSLHRKKKKEALKVLKLLAQVTQVNMGPSWDLNLGTSYPSPHS